MIRIILLTLLFAVSFEYVTGHAALTSPRSRQMLVKAPYWATSSPNSFVEPLGRHRFAMQCGCVFVGNVCSYKPDNLEKKCGICGEGFNSKKRLEKGGDLYKKFSNGSIQASYQKGSTVEVGLLVNEHFILFCPLYN